MIKSSFLTTLLTAATVCGTAHAATYSYNLSPADINAPGGILTVPANDVAGTGSLPSGINQSPAGGDGGSFTSVIDGTTDRYSQLYINLQVLFNSPTPIALDSLAGISYYTKGNSGQPLNWALRIYTAPTNTNHWYEEKFDGINPVSTGDWTLTDAATAGSFFLVTDRTGSTSEVPVTNLDWTPRNLEELKTAYSGKNILFFSVLAGDTANTSPLSSGLDQMVITLTNGDVATINFIPEPSTAALFALGSLGLLKRSRRQK